MRSGRMKRNPKKSNTALMLACTAEGEPIVQPFP